MDTAREILERESPNVVPSAHPDDFDNIEPLASELNGTDPKPAENLDILADLEAINRNLNSSVNLVDGCSPVLPRSNTARHGSISSSAISEKGVPISSPSMQRMRQHSTPIRFDSPEITRYQLPKAPLHPIRKLNIEEPPPFSLDNDEWVAPSRTFGNVGSPVRAPRARSFSVGVVKLREHSQACRASLSKAPTALIAFSKRRLSISNNPAVLPEDPWD